MDGPLRWVVAILFTAAIIADIDALVDGGGGTQVMEGPNA